MDRWIGGWMDGFWFGGVRWASQWGGMYKYAKGLGLFSFYDFLSSYLRSSRMWIIASGLTLFDERLPPSV
jgi:hypothetical protein